MTSDITTTPPAPKRWRLSRRDVVAGTVILLALCGTFVYLSSGASLLVTFVPGTLFTWLAFAYLYRRRLELPEVATFLPVFVVTLAIQFAHFGEEFATGFYKDFALLYGGQPYATNLFVVFNMTAYAAFALGAVAALVRPVGFALIPALFFLVYGAIGNAITHTWWSIMLGEYFPGLVTAQLFWIAGPWALHILTGRRHRRFIIGFIVLWALILIPLLTIFAEPANLAP